jgi:cysteine desulfurase
MVEFGYHQHMEHVETSSHIYLDYAATTPLLEKAADSMLPWLTEVQRAGNPSSLHEAGMTARLAVSRARATVAECLNAPTPESIVFTSGASEANNFIIKGVAQAWQTNHPNETGHHIISAIEHDAVLAPAEYLASHHGWELTILPVNQHGQVSPEVLAQAIKPNTALISIIHGNNEIGTLQPLAKLVDIAKSHQVPFHTDAVQTVGKLPIDVQALEIDYLSWSGHKFYGPKGSGGCYINPSALQPVPLIHGGGQENTHRSGTENVANIVGMATALRHQTDHLAKYRKHLSKLDSAFKQALNTTWDTHNPPALAFWNTPQLALRVPGIHHLSIIPHALNDEMQPLEGEALVLQLDLRGVHTSSGSACHGNQTGAALVPSRIVMALTGKTDVAELTQDELARCMATIRFSFGWHTTVDDVTQAAQALVTAVAALVKPMAPTPR